MGGCPGSCRRPRGVGRDPNGQRDRIKWAGAREAAGPEEWRGIPMAKGVGLGSGPGRTVFWVAGGWWGHGLGWLVVLSPLWRRDGGKRRGDACKGGD